jgi:hypothetical protein
MVMGFPEYQEEPQVKPPTVSEPSGANTKEITNVGIKDKIESKIGIPWKSIIGFATVFFGQLLARSTVNDIPVLPDNTAGIVSLIGGSFVASVVIYLKSNTYTLPQAEQKVDKAIKI